MCMMTRVGSRSRARGRDLAHFSSPSIASTESLRVTFRPEPRQQLQDMRPGKVAVLVTNEYEGIFRNGGIGTYYRQLSEALAAGGWRVLLLLTRTERRFAGHSTFPA